MGRPEPEFTLDAVWSEILGVVIELTEGAFTVTELADRTGQSLFAIRKKLRPRVASGELELVRKPIVDLAGRNTTVPAYRVRARSG
jgi:hypothetical protein